MAIGTLEVQKSYYSLMARPLREELFCFAASLTIKYFLVCVLYDGDPRAVAAAVVGGCGGLKSRMVGRTQETTYYFKPNEAIHSDQEPATKKVETRFYCTW